MVLLNDKSCLQVVLADGLPKVDFRNFIELAIPSLIATLKDAWHVQVAGAKTLSALAGYCVSNDAARVEVR
jgi:hypothetical protein